MGKTTFATKFRKPLFLCTEEGVGFHSVFKITIDTWTKFKSVLKQLVEKDANAERYGTIVVDTVDLLYSMCEKTVCEAKGITHPSDLEWGKGWAALKEEFQVVLSYMSRLKHGFVLIGHARVWEKKEKGGGSTSCMQPSLNGTGRRVVIPLVDVILYAYTDTVVDPATSQQKEMRLLRTTPTETVEAKDRTMKLPAILPMDHTVLSQYISGEKVKPPA